jgi:hypothetical protein
MPSVAYSGGAYLVTYDTYVDNFGYDVLARRVSTSGTLWGAAFSVASSTTDEGFGIAMKYGSGFLVMYHGRDNDLYAEARGQAISSSGTLVGDSQLFFSKNTTTSKVAIPVGAAVGTKIVFAVNRATQDRLQPISHVAFTNWDLGGAVVTP